MGSTIRDDSTQHWAGKAPPLLNGKWLKRALGAARKRDRSTMDRFKAEWSATYGPEYRGVLIDHGFPKQEIRWGTGDEYYQSDCVRDRETLRRPGEKARRRRLQRRR
jgi:hypothetical protein